MRGAHQEPLPTSVITSVAVEHVLLSYSYLDEGDVDGYGSLLEEDMQVHRPDTPDAHGRQQALSLIAEVGGPPGRHELYKIVASGDCVVATGRFTGPAAYPVRPAAQVDIDFADLFTISGQGLLLGQRRYYYVSPESAKPGE
ncbi:MAG TPA: nuclear transport factor 2 family protein [Pseudonocardiaceae bacterium]|nr:nuclear transport factor 2 family protein [Pseudonocardiaceae bacterium]